MAPKKRLRELFFDIDLGANLSPWRRQETVVDGQHPDLDLFYGKADKEPTLMLGFTRRSYPRTSLITIPIHHHQEQVVHWVCRYYFGNDGGIKRLCHAA